MQSLGRLACRGSPIPARVRVAPMRLVSSARGASSALVRAGMPRTTSAATTHCAASTPTCARGLASAATSEAEPLVQSTRHDRVLLLQLNRPKALNALNTPLVKAVLAELKAAEYDPHIGAIVLTGGEKVFAAGADIKEMNGMDAAEWRNVDEDETLLAMKRLPAFTKPIVAAVNGFCLGGGCELAMMCDISELGARWHDRLPPLTQRRSAVIAGDTAKFGQPEVNLGILPGAGGTQRLTHAIGKSKAMQMCLTGEPISAEVAERAGLVSEVVPAAETIDRAMAIATKIASQSALAVAVNKDAVSKSFEMTLTEGLNYERMRFFALFDSHDQKEGMSAFVAKRKPEWKHR